MKNTSDILTNMFNLPPDEMRKVGIDAEYLAKNLAQADKAHAEFWEDHGEYSTCRKCGNSSAAKLNEYGSIHETDCEYFRPDLVYMGISSFIKRPK